VKEVRRRDGSHISHWMENGVHVIINWREGLSSRRDARGRDGGSLKGEARDLTSRNRQQGSRWERR